MPTQAATFPEGAASSASETTRAFRRIGCRLKHRIQHHASTTSSTSARACVAAVSTPALSIKSMRGAVQTPTPAPPLAPSSGITAPAPCNCSAALAVSGPNDQAHGTSPGWVDRSLKLTSFKSTESRDDGGIQQATLLHSSACPMPIFSPPGTSNNQASSTKLLLTTPVPAAPSWWVKPTSSSAALPLRAWRLTTSIGR